MAKLKNVIGTLPLSYLEEGEPKRKKVKLSFFKFIEGLIKAPYGHNREELIFPKRENGLLLFKKETINKGVDYSEDGFRRDYHYSENVVSWETVSKEEMDSFKKTIQTLKEEWKEEIKKREEKEEELFLSHKKNYLDAVKKAQDTLQNFQEEANNRSLRSGEWKTINEINWLLPEKYQIKII